MAAEGTLFAVSPSGVRVAFELERFEVTDEDRLEVTGRWSGVRGLRFMRPSLTVKTEDGERSLLALLEHKPWAPEEGSDWIAAFPWQGGTPDPGQMELAVAPSVVVDLAPDLPAPSRKKQSLSERYERERKRTRRLEEEAAELRETSAALGAGRDQALAEQARLTNELSVAKSELADAAREREQALRQRDDAVRERDRLRQEYDEAVRQREAAEAQQAAAAAQVTEDALGRQAKLERLAHEQHEQIQQLTRERDAAMRQRDKARAEIEQAARERDGAVGERNEAVTRRLAAEAERDSALGRGTGAPLVEPAPAKRQADWLVRGLAVMAVITFFLLVVVILGHA
jgi:hypothetical protein